MMNDLTKILVKKILESPYEHDWSLQGLDMLRLYLDDKTRMHIWDDRYEVTNVSKLHTHPWHFHSRIVTGEVTNTRFVVDEGGFTYNQQTIFCGVGGGLIGESSLVNLKVNSVEHLREGDTYSELANEIHLSSPLRGSVTIIEREYLDDVDHALVFWEKGYWVSAEPRPATSEEVDDIVSNSLFTWF